MATISARLTYSRQHPDTHAKTISLLVQLETEMGLKSLSKMREPYYILERINNSDKNPRKDNYVVQVF